MKIFNLITQFCLYVTLYYIAMTISEYLGYNPIIGWVLTFIITNSYIYINYVVKTRRIIKVIEKITQETIKNLPYKKDRKD